LKKPISENITKSIARSINALLSGKLGSFTSTGHLIKRTRLKNKITQAELAKRLNVSSAFVSKVESGRASWPRNRTKQLRKILKIDEKILIGAMVSDDYRGECPRCGKQSWECTCAIEEARK